jgi:hypothetical protein
MTEPWNMDSMHAAHNDSDKEKAGVAAAINNSELAS